MHKTKLILPDSALSESGFDDITEKLIKELALRDSYYVVEKLLAALKNWVYDELIKATTSEEQLKVHAYAVIIKKLETKLKQHRSKLKRDKPILLNQGG